MSTIDEEIEDALELRIDDVKNLKEEFGSQHGGSNRHHTEEDGLDPTEKT